MSDLTSELPAGGTPETGASSVTYDPNNVFARLIRGDIPCNFIEETPHSLAFYDLFPKAPLHVLVIPKGPYVGADEFFSTASAPEILDFCQLLGRLPLRLGCKEKGYRLVSNRGGHGGQEVPHFHVHLLAGQRLGPMG